MKIAEFKIFRYTLPFQQECLIRGHKLEKREGLIIQLRSDGGMWGYGEVSPLPYFSLETLPEALEQLRRLQKNLIHQLVPTKIEELNGQFASWLDPYRLSASVRFGFEMAILNMKANAQGLSLSQLIQHNHDRHIYISGLLQGSTEKVTVQAKSLIDEGYHTLKLKVGSGSLEQDIAKVTAVSRVIESKALLRLDANQAWDLEQAIAFGQAVGLNTVEYIEEPLKDIEKIPEFFEQTTLPVALDESLLTASFDTIKSLSGAEVLIFKPTVLGGIEKMWQMTQKARRYGLEVILSSAFETGLGIITLAQLAACLYRHVAVGLDTGKWFARDLIKNPLAIAHGRYDVSQITPPIDEKILKEIAA